MFFSAAEKETTLNSLKESEMNPPLPLAVPIFQQAQRKPTVLTYTRQLSFIKRNLSKTHGFLHFVFSI